MKHRVTRAIFGYWDALRGTRPAPERTDIDPGAIRSCLAKTFILTFDPDRGHQFRIAGTSLCETFGSELTGTPFSELWGQSEQQAVCELIRTVTQDAEGVVAGVTGRNADGDTAELEMILLPLASGDKGRERLLGALAAVTTPYWLGIRPLQSLQLGEMRYTGAAGTEKLTFGQKVLRGPGFVLYPAAPHFHSTKLSGLTPR